jgi:protein arginine kinase
VVLRRDEAVSVMINEEDHLRMQALAPGEDLMGVWKTVNQLDSELEELLRYAFSRRLGYLTACPSNVGTGLRASVMLHLPALSLLNEVEPMIRGLTKIGLAVRGLLGEGTEASGNMFQISNQTTLGESEPEIMARLAQIVEEVAGHEKNGRIRLMERRASYVQDYVSRAVGVLLNARLLSSHELLDLLSAVRLGMDLDMVEGVTLNAIHGLILLTQPGHMQRMMGCEIGPEERDEARAGIVRDKLRRVLLDI